MDTSAHLFLSRRQALRRLVLGGAGAYLALTALLAADAPTGDRRPMANVGLDPALLDELAETILPATETPGAKAANVGAFIALAVGECFLDVERDAVLAGLARIQREFAAAHGQNFVGAPAAARTAYLNELQREAHATPVVAGKPPHFFRVLRELTILGFFSSEVACRDVVQYLEVPGSYNGDIPYKPGDKPWFS